jgi:nucleotide-binding universal stress UspA family protein
MYERILVALDGSDTSKAALKEAIRVAQGSPGSILRLVSVVEMPAAAVTAEGVGAVSVERALLDAAERIIEEAGAAVRAAGLEAETGTPECVGGAAAKAIVAEAERWKANLVVVGTHGRRGWRRLVMGSVAEGVARSADRPVLLVPLPHQRSQQN